MKKDRFLIGIVAGILTLIVFTIAVYFIRSRMQTYTAEDAPEGVVHNYVLAVFHHDYQRAYGYLSEGMYKPMFQEFYNDASEWSVDDLALQIGKANEGTPFSASVLVDPEGPAYYNNQAELVFQGGKWKLTNMVSPLWNYYWYREPSTIR